jgi:hypothetical protein
MPFVEERDVAARRFHGSAPGDARARGRNERDPPASLPVFTQRLAGSYRS